MIVNLFGAPGAGKSTTRARVFSDLKLNGVNVEETTEFAKDLVYEEREVALRCQPYVFGKQLRNMERVIGKVDVVVTDSPIFLSAYYGRTYSEDRYSDYFYKAIVEQFKMMGGVNYFIERVKPYNPSGRQQTETESDNVGKTLELMLAVEGVGYTKKPGTEQTAIEIADDIMKLLGR